MTNFEKEPQVTWEGFEKERDELARLGTRAKKLDEDQEHVDDSEMMQETVECLKDSTRQSPFSEFAAVGQKINDLSHRCVFELNIHSSIVYQAWSDTINPNPKNLAITKKAVDAAKIDSRI
jgi:hypothetical protein